MAPSMAPTVPPPLPLRSPPNMAAEADANVKGNIKNKCRIKIRLLQLQATITPRMCRLPALPQLRNRFSPRHKKAPAITGATCCEGFACSGGAGAKPPRSTRRFRT